MMRLQRALLVLTLSMLPVAVQAQVGKNSTNVLEPNLATKEQLAALPHFDAALADAVIKGRPYADVIALDKVLSTKLNTEQKTEVYRKLFIPINLNTASRAEILLVPGVGARMAHEFEEYRPYKAMAQFRREIGKYVNPAEVGRFEQYVFVPIDLNTATDEDIMSIPGLGRRMLHEFKEYRPYKSIEQFRREIGKYVNKDEVARLERYVFIPQ
jgi:DNA uptake protein ComE-like DNA-binding protein